MAYRYQWVWQWSAIRHFPTAAMTDELLRNIESQIREKLLSHSEITSIESITHSGVNFWTTNVGLTGNWTGTTTTVFVSTEAPQSPVAPAVIVAILALVMVAIIAAVIYFVVTSVSSTVTELAEKAPLALTAGAFAALGLVLIGGYMLVKREKRRD